MANTTSVKGSAAAKAVGTVKNIIGSATATDTSGVTRTLQVGDKVYANEVIKTSEAGAILIEFANGNNANLGRDSSMTLTGDIFGVQSALAQPQMTFGGQDLYPTLESKAAALCFSLVTNHPFIDGNKRIGHAATETFLVLNGFALEAGIDDAEQTIRR